MAVTTPYPASGSSSRLSRFPGDPRGSGHTARSCPQDVAGRERSIVAAVSVADVDDLVKVKPQRLVHLGHRDVYGVLVRTGLRVDDAVVALVAREYAPRLQFFQPFSLRLDRVIARFGDRIAYAVTLNEPNLPRLLAWAGLPEHIRQLERLTLTAAAERAGVVRYRAANVVLPEEFDAIADGMARAHRAARAAIKAQRPDLPVGLALAVVDDRVAGDDPTLRDRKRAEVYGRWLELAREDDFVGVQNYERTWYDASGPVPARSDTPRNQMGSAVEPGSLGGQPATCTTRHTCRCW
jgi:hypothetical protein